MSDVLQAAPTVVLMPCYDDWEAAVVLVTRLHETLERAPGVEYLLIDDGSSKPPPRALSLRGGPAPSVRVLRLRRNLGHQRAIAIGLAWLHANVPLGTALVMDSDGEDTPEGARALLEEYERSGGTSVVFAARARRTEGLVFRLLYACYRLLYRLLTGKTVRVGNFSVLPGRFLNRLVAVSELWNHYPAAVFKAGLSYRSVPIDRGRRIFGSSKMNVLSLVAHGLSAAAVFSELIALRLLVLTFVLALLALFGVAGVVGLRLGTELAIPGWATLSTGVFVIILFQAFSMAIAFMFVMLHSRNSLGFLPIRDYAYFVDGVDRLDVSVSA